MSFFAKLRGENERRVESIARNLESVLNAKCGHSAAMEVFGLGRYDGHFASRSCCDALTSEMLDQVQRFEPRLREPQIALIGPEQGLWVRFVLTGVVGESRASFAVLFHSVFRNVRVSRG